MRLATWNINRCRPNATTRASALRKGMRHVNADVWVLTETHVEFSPGPDFSLLTHSADAPDRNAENGECWVAIWSRLAGSSIQLTADCERVAAAMISGCAVIGTVLPWLSDSREPTLKGETLFRARLSEQSEDWRRLRTGGALCVAGDFNQDLLPAGHYYGSKGGRTALREALLSCELECLTSGDDDPLYAPKRANIDHICVHKMRPVNYPRSSAWPPIGQLNGITDHYCIYADIEQTQQIHATKPLSPTFLE
ncbi:MAG: endonuclease/exonuclease/phosphatase family protein [Phormidesmis sp.]